MERPGAAGAPIVRISDFLTGGFSSQLWCDRIISELTGLDQYKDFSFKVIDQGVVGQQSTCRPFNCPQYRYSCSVQPTSPPLYKEMASAACR